MIPEPILDIGFPIGVQALPYWHIGDPVRGVIGTAALADVDLVFTEVPRRQLITFSVDRGVQRVDSPLIRYDAGTATIVLDNPANEFDPDNLAGPYASDGQSQVTPMVPVRIRIRYGSTVYPLFYGFADSWDLTFISPTESRVTLRATDAFKIFGDANARTPLGSPVGDAESSGARINRILDSVGWPAGDRSIATGDTTMAPTILEGAALEEMQLVGDSELGQLYVDPSGKVVFRNRRAYITDPRASTSQATFGAWQYLGGGELPYKDRALDYGDDRIANQVLATTNGGEQQSKSDVASQIRYGVKSFARDDLVLWNDSLALHWAGLILYQSKDLEQWFTSLGVDPRVAEDLLYPQVLGRELGDRITVRRRPTNTLTPLNVNPYFAADASDWSVDLGPATFTRSTAFAHEGAASGALTPTGSALTISAATTRYPVAAAASYIYKAWAYSAAGWNGVTVAVNWFDSSQTLLTTTFGAQANVPAGQWTYLESMSVAPAGAAYAQLRVRVTNTPNAAVYFDEAWFGLAPITRDCLIRGISHSYGPGPNQWGTKWTLQSASKYAFFTIADPAKGAIGAYGLA